MGGRKTRMNLFLDGEYRCCPRGVLEVGETRPRGDNH